LATPGAPSLLQEASGDRPAIVVMDELPAATRQPAALPAVLTLEACVQQAVALHPDLAAAAAAVDAERGEEVQAGLYPNPTIGYSAQELNARDGEAGQQGIMLGQRIVTGNKLGLATEAAARGVEAADWQARAKLFEVVTRVRLAFYEALTARQEVQVAREVLAIAKSGHEVAEKMRQADVVGVPDVLRAKVELEQSQIKLTVAEQRAQAAVRLLAASMGLTELPSGGPAGALTAAAPAYELSPLLREVLTVSADLAARRALVQQAEAALARAEAEVIPDVEVQVNPFYGHPDRRAQVSVQLSAAVPVFNRNQGNILAARAALTRAHAAIRQSELQLTERVTQAFQRYQNARAQVQAYEKNILPTAQESVRLLTIAYSQDDKRYDYTALLEAQRSLANAKLGLVQAQGELQKAVAELEGLLQRVP
jgi:cobalt-zinc-cadmium efflux system outer membrane protein